jgi:hypothetical protein
MCYGDLSNLKKSLLRSVPLNPLRAGAILQSDFHGLGMNRIDSGSCSPEFTDFFLVDGFRLGKIQPFFKINAFLFVFSKSLWFIKEIAFHQ